MPTISSKSIIDELIADNGDYYDDPPVVKIVQYTNKWGTISYGVIYQGMSLDHYAASEFIINPMTIFERKWFT